MTRIYRNISLLLAMVCFTGLHAWCQGASAEVNGIVADSTGAALAGATVTLTSQDTKIAETTKSSSSGGFIFVNVQPGNYTLSVSAPNFRTVDLAPFELSVNQTFSQTVKLNPGSASETVEVSANTAELLQRSSSELGTVIQQDVIEDMPLNGRNFTELLTLTPGATPVSTAQGSGVSTQDAGMSGVPSSFLTKPALHGQQNRSTLYYLDGVTNTDLRGPVYGVLPMIDATSQFKVQAHDAKVEFGGVVGGVVNMVSRAGTNTIHGSVFEFVRNNYFDARDPFKDAPPATGPAAFHQNQFGATIFGPIFRDRTFFAGSYEGWRFSQPTQTFATVPTAAEMSGDLTSTPNNFPIYNPYSTVPSGKTYARTRFLCDASGNPVVPNASGIQTTGTACNKIPSQLINPLTSKLLTTFVRGPNYAGAAASGTVGTNYEEDRAHIDNNNEFQVKVDHRISSKDNVWLRFTNMYVHDLSPVTGTIENAPSDYHGYDWGAGYSRVLSQHSIFDAQAGILLKPYVFNQNTTSSGYKPISDLGVTDASTWGGLFAALASPYFTSDIGTRGASLRKNPAWSASTDLTFLIGKHNVKVGLQFTNVQRVQQNTYQQFSFSTAQTQNPSASSTGDILASVLLGVPSSYTGNLPQFSEDDFSFHMWSGFIQDEWRLLPRLTFNMGLRYDYLSVPQVLDGRTTAELDLTHQLYIVGSAQPPDCATTMQNPCIPGKGFASVAHNTNIIFTGFNKSFLAPKASELEPRFGLAYQLRDTLVLRAGWGLFFDALPARSQYAQNQLEAAYWPWATGFSGNINAIGSPLTSINAIEGHFSTPSTSASPWSNGGYYDSPNFRPAYSNQWNLELQQQIDRYTAFSIAYVGSSNAHTDYTGYANAAPFASPASTPRTTVDNYRAIPWMVSSPHWGDSSGHSSYNALETRIMRQASHSLRMILSYTWGKSLDNSSGYFAAENGPGGGSAVQNYWDPRSNRSVSSYDIPHFVSLATLYDLPLGHGQRYFNHGAAAYLLGDWQSNFLLQARSGQPFNLVVNGDVANISGSLNTISGYARPSFVPGVNPVLDHPSTAMWFNTAAFTTPSGFGNVPRNLLRSGRVVNSDFSMFKLIPIHERVNAQLRFEAFNVFNIHCLGYPGQGNSNQVVYGVTGFGAISALAYNPRQLQFGVRVTY